MKVYNIQNGKEFFEKIAACEGAVELVNEKGERLQLTQGLPNPSALPLMYFDGAIREMELFFQNQDDCTRILYYLMNKRHLAA